MATSKIKDRFMNIRLPADIDQQLRALAERNTRILSAQALHCIKMEIARIVKDSDEIRIIVGLGHD